MLIWISIHESCMSTWDLACTVVSCLLLLLLIWEYISFRFLTVCVFTYVVNIIESLMYSKQQSQTFDHLYALANEHSKRFSEKLFKLKIKSVLVPLLVVMKGVWMIGIFRFFGLEAVTFVYFNCFMLLRSVQFHMIADGIRVKLEIINEDLIDLLKVDKFTVDLKVVKTKMEKIRSDYVRLKDLSIAVNDSNGWSMLCLAFLFACFLICISYWFILSLFKEIMMLKPYESICYIFVLFLVLAVTADPCTQCLGLVNSVPILNALITNKFLFPFRVPKSVTTSINYNN